MEASESGRLKRELSLGSAIMMGLGSILGTGIFVSIGLAAGVAGASVLLAIALAAVVATCNALSSAQLAAAHPVSGGAYEYGYRYLHPAAGFLAGWMFLLAKSASAATAALGFSGYVLAITGASMLSVRWLAFGAVLLFTVLVLCGIRRSAWVNNLVVGVTLIALLSFVLTGFRFAWTQTPSLSLQPFFQGEGSDALMNLFHATALMFVAYTGYGRIATLAEEVKDPARSIPRAIIATLVISGVLYVLVAAAAILAVGAPFLAAATLQSAAPLEMAAQQLDAPGLPLIVAVGATTAMLGVLLNLILGLSRVVLAMGRRGDMSHVFGRLNRTETTPKAATLLVGAGIAGLSLVGSVETTWSFSAFTVLIYYAITNAAVLALPKEDRLFPRWIAVAGLGACLFLAFWVSWTVWLSGLGLALAGLVWHGIRQKMMRV